MQLVGDARADFILSSLDPPASGGRGPSSADALRYGSMNGDRPFGQTPDDARNVIITRSVP
jgi:hypothetical protein